MAKYSSRGAKTIFIRHRGATNRDVYFRVNPQALRVQQGNKGSVVDTLGGYFREVMYAQDPQHSGLMLPDLTIECETGAGYREELKKFEDIWRRHGDPKPDGSPADTLLMDFADADTEYFDGGVTSQKLSFGKGGLAGAAGTMAGAIAGPLPQGAMLQDLGSILPKVGKAHESAFSIAGKLGTKMRTGIGKGEGGTRYSPRVFLIEILNFAWDETVQDPYRIRFNFRCKVLRDLLWKVERRESAGKTMFSLGSMGSLAGASGALMGAGLGAVGEGSRSHSSNVPLNVAGQLANMQRTTSGFSLPPQILQPTQDVIGQVLGLAGLGQNRIAQKALELGRSAFGLTVPTQPSGTRQDQLNLNALLTELITELPQITGIPTGTTIQVGDWQVPIPAPITDAVRDLNLGGLSFFPPTAAAVARGGDRPESEAWR